jgi:hypothetical protein
MGTIADVHIPACLINVSVGHRVEITADDIDAVSNTGSLLRC